MSSRTGKVQMARVRFFFGNKVLQAPWINSSTKIFGSRWKCAKIFAYPTALRFIRAHVCAIPRPLRTANRFGACGWRRRFGCHWPQNKSIILSGYPTSPTSQQPFSPTTISRRQFPAFSNPFPTGFPTGSVRLSGGQKCEQPIKFTRFSP